MNNGKKCPVQKMSTKISPQGYLHNSAVTIPKDSTIFMVPGIFQNQKNWRVGLVLPDLLDAIPNRVQRRV
jgi:hypothetical protein